MGTHNKEHNIGGLILGAPAPIYGNYPMSEESSNLSMKRILFGVTCLVQSFWLLRMGHGLSL